MCTFTRVFVWDLLAVPSAKGRDFVGIATSILQSCTLTRMMNSDCQINGFDIVQFKTPLNNVIYLVKTFNPSRWQNSFFTVLLRHYFHHSPHSSGRGMEGRLTKFYWRRDAWAQTVFVWISNRSFAIFAPRTTADALRNSYVLKLSTFFNVLKFVYIPQWSKKNPLSKIHDSEMLHFQQSNVF